MNWNDYEAVWKRQELPVGAGADLPRLRETFETKRRRLAATLLVRDLLETSAGLFASGVFAYVWWHIGKEGWPIALAIILMLGLSGFFLRERLRAHRHRLGPDAPLLARLEAEIAGLRHQRHLLLNLWSWYLAPCAGAIVIFVATLVRLLITQAPPELFTKLWEHPIVVVGVILPVVAVQFLVFWGVWALNRRAVRKGVEPRLAELEKLHRDLLAPN